MTQTDMQPNLPDYKLGLSLLFSAVVAASAQAQPAYTELTSSVPWPGARFGLELGGLPDLTGDGVGEFYILQDGRIEVYDGENLQSLYGLDGATIGVSARSAGNLNGDGIPDLMFGHFVSFDSFAGRVVFTDGSTGSRLSYIESPNPIASGYFGKTLRLLPDMTGDGQEDWLIHQQESQSRGGRVYIIDSQTQLAVRTIQNTEAANRFWMEFVEIIPDVDGDGKPELLVSTKNATVTRDGQTFSNAGRAIVRSLQAGAVLYELLDPEPQTGGWFGSPLTGIGDVNGDGIGDIAIGAYQKDSSAGAIYLFSGKDGRWLRTLRAPNPQLNGKFGRKIEVLPDLNGDGVPELWTSEDGRQRTHVFDGATSALLRTIEYSGVFANLSFIGTVRQQAPPGIRAYLFGSEVVNNSEGRVYYLPFTPLPKPPQLKPLGRGATGFRLQVIGDAGSKVDVQSTSDFQTWESVASVTLGNQAADVEDSGASGFTRRFYRAAQKE